MNTYTVFILRLRNGSQVVVARDAPRRKTAAGK
jgi:hypothetical protein